MLIGKDYLHDNKMPCKFLALIWANVYCIVLLMRQCKITDLFPNDLLVNRLFDKTFFWNERICLCSNYFIHSRFGVSFSLGPCFV